MKNINKKYLFYGFVLCNIALLIYAYFEEGFLDPKMIKSFLVGQYFLLSYIAYILILIVRGLTLIPGTAFIVAGVYLFPAWQVYLAIEIAISCYCLIIYNFAYRLNFKIPEKILRYEQKIKNKEIPIIFALCLVPGISINVLVYFLSITGIKLRNILIGIIAGTCISSFFYIYLWKGIIESADYLV